MPFASSSCVVVSASSTTCNFYQNANIPLLAQDAGNVSFGLALILGILFLGVTAFLFNSFGGSKRR